MQSALDQPEILSYIAEFLTQSDHSQCAQVSRDWYRTFCPLVWKGITLTNRKSRAHDLREIDTETLVRHSHLVRKLVCDSFFLPKTNPDTKINHKISDSHDNSKREKNKAALKAKFKAWKQEQQQKLRERHPLTFPHLEVLVFRIEYKFKCQSELARLVTRNCQTLQRFTLSSKKRDDITSLKIWDAITSCSRLEYLLIECFTVQSLGSWSAFHRLWSQPSLRHLRLESVAFFPMKDSSRLRQQRPQNNSGSAQGSFMSSVASIFKENLGISKIKQLELDDIDGEASQFDQQLLLLQSCPDLERFKWEIPITMRQDIQRRNSNLGQILKESLLNCPKLVHLEIILSFAFGGKFDGFGEDAVSEDPKEDNQVDEVLSFLQARSGTQDNYAFQSLTFPQNWFGPQCWNLVKSHPVWPVTLRHLNIQDAVHLPGAAVQEMLCTLKNLKTFAAARITDTDVLSDPRPWICLSLTKLTLGIVVTATEKQEQRDHRRMFFERIGTLTSLTELILLCAKEKGIRTLTDWIHSASRIPIPTTTTTTTAATPHRRVKSGSEKKSSLLFGPMKNLCRLEVIEFGLDTAQRFTKQDLEWMIQHWPRLRVLIARLHSDGEVHKELREFLSTNHVSHRRPYPKQPVSFVDLSRK
ncbi:hypothetical protein BGZ83_010150 [Gryganskiella cystojenkinii]|nr:hypothetical protein BGZ83_010150 [Gryganskiella cystojenkinii]